MILRVVTRSICGYCGWNAPTHEDVKYIGIIKGSLGEKLPSYEVLKMQ